MNKWWLSLALGAGLLACGTENLPTAQRPGDTSDDSDEDDDDAPTGMNGGLDAGAKLDAGKKKTDAGKKASDAGAGMVSCAADGAVVVTPPPAPPHDDTGVGASCGSDDDCGDDMHCLTEVSLPIGSSKLTFPGGYCTKQCATGDACGPSAGCPLAMAAQFSPELSNCMAHCAAADDCRDGYTCGAIPSFGGQAPSDPQKHCLPPSPFGAGGPSLGGAPAGAMP